MLINVTNDLNFLNLMPDDPGVYRYYDINNELLYVGKAINLKKRVKSYFQRKSDLSPRITLMVSKIHLIEVTVTDNEVSALLLESNLIKTLKPKYNIIFRDDKSYPYIRISNHDFPLVEYFRGKSASGDKLYGPYPNSYAVRENLDILQRLFKLRTCSDGEFANRSRACMLHQIDLCCAPCVNKVSKLEYSGYVNYAHKFLSGDYADLISKLSAKMYESAENLEFEVASSLRDKISLVRELQNKQIISDSNVPINADIILVKDVSSSILIYLIFIRNGLYIGDKHFSFAKVDSAISIVEGFIESYYEESSRISVFIDYQLTDEFLKYASNSMSVNLSSVFSGRISELRQMGYLNLQKVIENKQIDNIYIDAISKISKYIGIEYIKRIECYDTSHNHGVSAVASMVVFSDGKMNNKLYRRFNLSDSVGGDDLLALEIVLRRRFANSEIPLPNVILIDGGSLQLNLAKNLISELGFHDKISVIAIYKGDNRNPELDSVIIKPDLELSFREEPNIFRLLQLLRDEAHRFAIVGHRKKQVDRMSYSRLEDIPGVGAKKRKALIAFFGSANNVAAASIDDLQQVDGVGLELATSIHKFFTN